MSGHSHSFIVGAFLGAAALLCILCALGTALMRDAYQRLHFPTGVVSLAMLFVTIAIFVDDPTGSVRIKTVLTGLLLFFMNGVLSHMTAQAVRIRGAGRWEIDPKEKIPLRR